MADLNLIKKLRETTSCGIGDCSKALAATNDDFDQAIDWLRKKGLSAATKKSGRVTSEGVVAINTELGNKATIVEINSETDFVARNQQFQQFCANIAKLALNSSSVEELKSLNYFDASHEVEEELKNQIGVIGENLNIRRSATLSVGNGLVASYVHNPIASNMGKIGVLVAFETSYDDKQKLAEFGKQIAMHIAASKPDALSVEKVDPSKLQRETEVLKEQARNSGKPESIIEKMIEGRIKKYYEEVVLLEQPFVMDDKLKIKDLVAKFNQDNKSDVKISDFRLFILGEGIDKKESDFAKEVAEMTKK